MNVESHVLCFHFHSVCPLFNLVVKGFGKGLKVDKCDPLDLWLLETMVRFDVYT